MPKIAYNAIHADLLWKMEAGLIAPGDRLPSENELVKRYDVSRMTMRKVLRMLADEGYLASRAGVGWEVLRTNRQEPTGRKIWRIGVDRLPYYFARCYRDTGFYKESRRRRRDEMSLSYIMITGNLSCAGRTRSTD